MSDGTTKGLAGKKSLACPCCSATMDEQGYWFASQIVRDGIVYFCNNPACNGGRRSTDRQEVVMGREASIN